MYSLNFIITKAGNKGKLVQNITQPLELIKNWNMERVLKDDLTMI
jgi:hypothetical protein